MAIASRSRIAVLVVLAIVAGALLAWALRSHRPPRYERQQGIPCLPSTRPLPIPPATKLPNQQIEQSQSASSESGDWAPEVLQAASAAGVKMMPVQTARQVAEQFGSRRWKGCRIGPAVSASAPDGVLEACFFIVYRPGAAERSVQELIAQAAAARLKRVEMEKQLADAGASAASPERTADLRAGIKAAWSQMRGDDQYATVVVGANDGREPFIASFAGLPPQIVLREDAIEMCRKQLGGKDPGEPRSVWLPPLFVIFQFPGGGAGGAPLCFEARGTELGETRLSDWTRSKLPEDSLRERRAKWESFKDAKP